MKKITEIDPQTAAQQVIPMLDDISPSMCMAKWLWSSIHLTNGLTNSCFLPPLHKIDAEAVKRIHERYIIHQRKNNNEL